MTEIPLKPFQHGKVSSKFGGDAQSPKEVLERARVTLSPRGSWRKGGFKGNSHEGATRCLRQALTDCDGQHVSAAEKILLKAAKEVTGKAYSSVPGFNDAAGTHKHTVIQVLDKAIEIA